MTPHCLELPRSPRCLDVRAKWVNQVAQRTKAFRFPKGSCLVAECGHAMRSRSGPRPRGEIGCQRCRVGTEAAEGTSGYSVLGVNYNEGGDECFGHRSRPGAHSVHPCGATDSRVILSNDADESGSMNGPKPMVV